MPVLVSDTSVLIDLERGSFLEPVFRLPFEFAVPDLLYERELRDHGGPALIDMGLRVEELDGAAVALALEYRRVRRSLSLPDSFALALSKANSWTLLSGDGSLRALALRGSRSNATASFGFSITCMNIGYSTRTPWPKGLQSNRRTPALSGSLRQKFAPGFVSTPVCETGEL